MRRKFLSKFIVIIYLFHLLVIPTEAGCFPKRKRKAAKVNVLLAAMSAKIPSEERQEQPSQSQETEPEETVEHLQEVNVPIPHMVQMVEQGAEASSSMERRENRQSHDDAIQLLARVLINVTGRPRPHRRDFFAYQAVINLSSTPIIENTFRAYLLSEIFRIKSKIKIT